MSALAYVLLPLSGLVAFVTGGDARVRFHGAQAIVFGTLWGAILYLGSALSAAVTVAVAAVGSIVWILLLAAAAMGRDPALPLIGRLLWKAAQPER